MERRKFVAGLLALPIIGNVLKAAPISDKVGHVSVRLTPRLATRARAWLDGREVSNDCVEADDIKGYVRILKRGGHGRFYIDPATNELAEETIQGDVTIRLRNG